MKRKLNLLSIRFSIELWLRLIQCLMHLHHADDFNGKTWALFSCRPIESNKRVAKINSFVCLACNVYNLWIIERGCKHTNGRSQSGKYKRKEGKHETRMARNFQQRKKKISLYPPLIFRVFFFFYKICILKFIFFFLSAQSTNFVMKMRSCSWIQDYCKRRKINDSFIFFFFFSTELIWMLAIVSFPHILAMLQLGACDLWISLQQYNTRFAFFVCVSLTFCYIHFTSHIWIHYHMDVECEEAFNLCSFVYFCAEGCCMFFSHCRTMNE